MCVKYILARSASSPDLYEVTTDLMLANMKNDIFPLISFIILMKALTPCEYIFKRSLWLIEIGMWQQNITSKNILICLRYTM